MDSELLFQTTTVHFSTLFFYQTAYFQDKNNPKPIVYLFDFDNFFTLWPLLFEFYLMPNNYYRNIFKFFLTSILI